MATSITPGRTRFLAQRTILALMVAVLVILLLVGTAMSQATSTDAAGAYRPCPPRSHWECNE